MPFDYSRIWPYGIALLAALVIYRRFRRSFGCQLMRPMRMRVRIGVFLVLGCSMLPLGLKSSSYFAAEAAGLAAGLALGLWGADRTRYQMFNGQLHYIPHTYTGIAVSLLFIGRLVYRTAQAYSMNSSPGMEPGVATQPGLAPSMSMSSPLTAGLLFVVIGYYVCYYGKVLWRSTRISPEDLEVPATSTAATS